jgi:hypothetical protein
MVKKRSSKKSKVRLAHQVANPLSRFHSLDGLQDYLQDKGLQVQVTMAQPVNLSLMDLEEEPEEGLYLRRTHRVYCLP